MKRYGRYDARTPKKLDADEEVGELLREALNYLDQQQLVDWKSETTLRYQRGLSFWSVLVLTVFGLDLQIDRVAGVELRALDDFERVLVNAGLIAVLLYHWVMYRLHEYQDRLFYELRSELIDLTFAPSLADLQRRAEALGVSGRLSEELVERGRAAREKLSKGLSPTAFGLQRLMQVVPVVLFVSAMVVLSMEYGAVNILFGLVVFVPQIIRWIEKRRARQD